MDGLIVLLRIIVVSRVKVNCDPVVLRDSFIKRMHIVPNRTDMALVYVFKAENDDGIVCVGDIKNAW